VKLLLDENLSHRLTARLSAAFPRTQHVDDLNMRGQPDTLIWDRAARDGFVIVSKDDDFRQLSQFRGAPPKVVWLVVGNAGTGEIAKMILDQQKAIEQFASHPEDALLTLRLD
tara:strand:+ start:32004 stop:32342 length:339 start_codon:yes stop_codon:yes gene_type:complete